MARGGRGDGGGGHRSSSARTSSWSSSFRPREARPRVLPTTLRSRRQIRRTTRRCPGLRRHRADYQMRTRCRRVEESSRKENEAGVETTARTTATAGGGKTARACETFAPTCVMDGAVNRAPRFRFLAAISQVSSPLQASLGRSCPLIYLPARDGEGCAVKKCSQEVLLKARICMIGRIKRTSRSPFLSFLLASSCFDTCFRHVIFLYHLSVLMS